MVERLLDIKKVENLGMGFSSLMDIRTMQEGFS